MAYLALAAWRTILRLKDWRKRLASTALWVGLAVTSANAGTAEIPPFKDDLFRYPGMTATRDRGSHLDVPYSEQRDIDERDEIPERRVARRYVDLKVNRTKVERTVETNYGPIRTESVGDTGAPAFIVVFMHGRNGDRRLGMNDWTFGGNFNRVKNLVSSAGGLYVTADGGSFTEADANRFAALVSGLKSATPSAPIVLACGSMGGEMCWTLLSRLDFAPKIAGLVLLGSNSDVGRFEAMRSARGANVLPLLVAQGTQDRVYLYERQKAFFDAVRRKQPSYPIRFVTFETGNHGTPIRMIDWRTTLEWILSTG